MRSALIVIDMLNDFVDPDGKLCVPDNRMILPNVSREIAAARAEGQPVVYLCDAHKVDDPEFALWGVHAIKGTEGAKVVDELAPLPGDSIVEKTTYSGFYASELERVLRDLDVDTVRLTGCVTNICVLYTGVDAKTRGFDVEVVCDGVAGLDPAEHRFALDQLERVVGATIVGRR